MGYFTPVADITTSLIVLSSSRQVLLILFQIHRYVNLFHIEI